MYSWLILSLYTQILYVTEPVAWGGGAMYSRKNQRFQQKEMATRSEVARLDNTTIYRGRSYLAWDIYGSLIFPLVRLLDGP